MKTFYLSQKIVQFIVIIFFISSHCFAIKDSLSNKIPQTEQMMANTMIDRLEEIKKMDKTSFTRTEKKTLRKEVRTIKAKLQQTSRGVYLSVGAIIIIILLLILLL